MNKIPYIFFGTGPIARFVLEELERAQLTPALIVTSPDMPQGRKLELAPSPVKIWADTHSIETLQPEELDAAFLSTLIDRTKALTAPVYVVTDYGKILPQALLDIPPRGILNVHPSLLPRLRGPSPIRSAILTNEKETGVTVMLIDAKMDHGPILSQKRMTIEPWPPHATHLEETLAREGGRLLATVLPLWVREEIEAREQQHDLATFCKMIKKEHAQISLSDDAYTNLLKIRAYEGWPIAFTYFQRGDKKIRVQILDAHIKAGMLIIERVKPEGKNEMEFLEFMKSGATPV